MSPRRRHCAFLTDSLSLLQAMENDHPDTADIRSRLIRACGRVDLLYVPGHKDIPGNELTPSHSGPPDQSSRQRSTMRPQPTGFESNSTTWSNCSTITWRRRPGNRALLLGQLVANHHKDLNYYKNFVDGEVSDRCERCNSGQIDDVEHWLTQCGQTAAEEAADLQIT